MKETLEMALEALEWADNFHNEGEPVQARVAEAIAALKGAITQQEKDSRADYCGSCGQWTGGPVICCHESESNPKPLITKAEAKALREAIKNQGEPVGYVRKYALEHLKNTQAHTVIDAAPRADDDVALFVSSPEKKYQCIGVIDANGDIYPGQPDPGTQVYVALNADVDTSAPETSQTSLPEGWQLVPIELTEEMFAADDPFMEDLSNLGEAWGAMLSAAPKENSHE